MLWGTRLVPALGKYLQGPSPWRHGLEKLEHHQHQGSLVHPLGLRASGDLAWFSQLDDLGGLSTFGDSLSVGALFVEGSGLMSWGTLHRGSQIKK
jgi:hypothetical protein